jgi:hypothetical protein
MKTMILNAKTGREVQENQWVTRKDYRGLYSKYEILEIYEDDETARVRYLTGDDGYLYTTQGFHKLGLRKVLL